MNSKAQASETYLVDGFGRKHDYLRISITDRCNLRCTYCMPEDKNDFAAASHLMSTAEISEIAAVFVKYGVKKIRLTGGEPLVRKEAGEIISKLGHLGVELTITTNAVRAGEFINTFHAAGIKSLNISLDTFNRDKFKQITRRDEFDKVISNIHVLISQGFHVKLNMVAMRGVNDDEVVDFVHFSKDFPVHVRFIEFMPFDGNKWERSKVITCRELLPQIEAKFVFEKLHDEQHSTAKKYKVSGGLGTFAFINTISQPFCSDCNRMRLTADGKMKNCLFSMGETDLLTAYRNGDDIESLIKMSVMSKQKATGGQNLSLPLTNRSMVAIGG